MADVLYPRPLNSSVGLLRLCEVMRKLLDVGTLVLLCMLLLTSPNLVAAQSQEQDWVARHRAEDREWAHKTGLSSNLIRQMRLMADVPDDESDYIDSVDAKSLRARNQILLVTAGGNGHCLGLYVFARRRADYQLIWSAPAMPSGAGFCRESPHNPEAYVARGRRIIVKIPVFDYKKLKPKATDLYTYVWNGRTYSFVGRRTVSVKERQARSKYGAIQQPIAARRLDASFSRCFLRRSLCASRSARLNRGVGRLHVKYVFQNHDCGDSPVKQIILAACFSLVIPLSSFAEGSFSFQDLVPILNQQPALAKYLFSTLDFAEGGIASRIGQSVNERLGGKRLGAYRILAKPKGTEGEYVLEVIVHTERLYMDEVGKQTALRSAFSVVEKLKHVEIRGVEAMKRSRRPTSGSS